MRAKTSFRNSFLVMLLLLICSALPLLAGSISGTITDENGQPINHANVQLMFAFPQNGEHGGNGIGFRNTITAETGNYTFENIPAESYYVYANAPGFVRSCYADPETGEIQVVEIDADDQEIVGIDIQLTPQNDPPPHNFGAISGNVIGLINNNNMGMMAEVGLVTVSEPTVVLPNLFGHVNFNGHYVINHIPAGSYMACLLDEEHAPIAFSAPVEVIANQMTENVNIIVGTTPMGYSLSGYIYNAENGPVTNGVVELRSTANDDHNHQGMMHHEHRMVHPDSSGYYVFTNVAAGEYYVSVWTMGSPVVFYPSVYNIDEATAVTVTDQDVTGINITIPDPQNYTVSGYVKDADTQAPLAGIKVRTDRMGFHHFPMHDPMFNNEYQALTDANGFYTLTLPVGRYTLAAVDTTHFYRIQFYDHAQNPFHATVIMLDENLTDINFDLIPRQDSLQCSISGTITENGEAVTYPVTVVAVSSDEDWEESTVTNASGAYTINHLRPGNYYVVAYSIYTAPTYYDNVLTWEDADAVAVHGPVSGIDFNLTASEADGPCNLSGRITDAEGQTIANAIVMLTGSNNEVLGFARANETGFYTVSNVPSQVYTVVTTKLGYGTVTQNLTLTGNQSLNFVLNAPTTNEDAVVPVVHAAMNIYPNPFKTNAVISYTAPKDSQVAVRIYNLKGQCIKTLLNSKVKSGSHTLVWDGSDHNGKSVANGIYFVKLQGTGFTISQKITIMR
ncbi:MAG TPA: carboxypeptidase regulatory-like domain-containing protein [Candidatus Cloacimonadota bacterium]|nr:carboxypeptidase regulatory-like domain-containing protein [Candidatus Cloacimonadota bacterium]